MNLEIHGYFHVKGLHHFDGVDPAKHGPLVICRAAAKKLFLLFNQIKGIGVPAVLLLQRWLNVQMAVNQQSLE